MLTECLDGIRVLDLSQYIPGPFAAKALADLGADVIKVEPPQGDPMRTLGGTDTDGLSPAYKMVNRGKQIVFLNLKDQADKQVLRALIAQADVLIESYRPGVLDRLGFDRDTLKSLNPQLVHCALSGFGQTGPYRLRAGHDITYLSVAGMLGVTGTADEPIMPFPPIADHAGALYAALSVCAALVRQTRRGEGAYLDVSLCESALSFCSGILSQAERTPVQREEDLLNGGAAYYRTYRCADGRHIALGAIEPKFWEAFCSALGRPDWVARQNDPLPQSDLCSEVAAAIAAQPLSHWESLLHPQDCCFEPVHTVQEVLDHPQTKARGLVVTSTHDSPPLHEVLFPCIGNETPPQAPTPHQDISPAHALTRWGAETPTA